MKLNRRFMRIGLAVLVLALLVAMSTAAIRVVGQGPEDDGKGSEVDVGSEGQQVITLLRTARVPARRPTICLRRATIH